MSNISYLRFPLKIRNYSKIKYLSELCNNAAADLHITPDGRFLYGSERTSSTITGFTVHPTDGTLALIGSVPTEQQPRGFNIDPSGCYVLAVGQLSHALSSYRIDAHTGQLTKLNTYPMGNNPNWVEIIALR